MAPRRLSDSEKQDLVGRYKAGESTAALAEALWLQPKYRESHGEGAVAR